MQPPDDAPDKLAVRRYLRASRLMRRAFVRSPRVHNFDVFAQCFEGPEPANVVSLLNHGPAHSLMALLPVLLETAHDHGLGEERPGMIWHRAVDWLPGMGRVARRLAGGEPVTSVDEAVRALEDGSISMFGTMPEGATCLLDFGEPIGPFEKNGLIAVGLAAGSTFMLCVHKGTEDWVRTIPLPAVVFDRITPRVLSGSRGARGVRVPFVTRRAELRLTFEVYEPSIGPEAFARLERDERRACVRREAGQIRARIAELHEAL